jgi:actin-related protein
MFQDLTSLVFDIGTYSSKIGYGGDDSPRIISSSYLSKNSNSM